MTCRDRRIRPPVTVVEQCRSMDSVADNQFNWCRIRVLTVVDNFSRECVAIEVGQGLRGDDVVAVMERIRQTQQRAPRRLQTDNGSEFISKTLERWAYENGVEMDFSRFGKPTYNALVESCNVSLRDEYLNVHWFLSLEDAWEKIEHWRQ
ncbi:Transposase, probable fragment [Erwinia tasmaniensis Et1/99]|uniref:Transposase, probable n=1 Tax=Erwinia tasmaniensis (strain DSM 17950 / CFBP 7177 / CIP 109463 / NCPPB 4357 / Et1/99) TaxID=465817 RepID=B2VEX2_ERWT9|nr:Transposase, probable fragment [Erwinia tasmaniensis Et1/99]